ncbi:hypothetical protein GCM10007860_03630 [Chitiniphilus shinanonensis]|uniref:COX assembly mitochondrial protein n=1 Tax=Chitiniphilus shinanonensis TaxID=553088 RepID=A0ABQ6BMI7_9NEIS|nr:hypothetical protein [Chitiniphilus shinanonensis]GLS03220.1 hypothetical protein GCM10007860_03630 [Chitiniphilus shinanonensis]
MNAINKQTENGKAIGAACRHSGRALEDCFRRNPRVAKADIFDGWKEMNEYMLQKKLDIVPPPPDPVVQRRAEPSDKDASKTEARAQTK